MEEAVAQKKRFYSKRDIPELYAQLLKEAGEIAQNRDMRRLIHRAMRIAQKSHAQQARKSGEPYIIHPITVARYVTRICPKDIDVILAGLLHDVVEDSEVTVQDLQNLFPEREHLPQIVDGLTKFKDTEENDGVDDSPQVATYRRLLTQTIEEDPRIILVKMADRLHNMQTLEFKEKSKQHKIVTVLYKNYFAIPETLDSLIKFTFICPGYCISSSIFLAISCANITMSSSVTFSGTTIILTSLPACIANDLSTPVNELVISSSCLSL